MTVYTSKCAACAERTKKSAKVIRCRDEKGRFEVNFFECSNYDCEICVSAIKSKRKSFAGRR